jgi:Domain of unknown function (DUF5664)
MMLVSILGKEHVMPLADSGDRTVLSTGAVRDLASGRGRFDLLSPVALEELAKLAEAGAAKYSSRNWERGFPLSSFMNSAMRHLNSLAAGRTNEDHATAVMWNMMAFIHTRYMIEQGTLPATLAEGWLPEGVGPLAAPTAPTTLDGLAFDHEPRAYCQYCKEAPDGREIVPTNLALGVWMHHDCWCWTNAPSAI